jgi:Flp pilus assembly protein TadD
VRGVRAGNGAVLIALLLAGGCAARPAAGLADRLVRRGDDAAAARATFDAGPPEGADRGPGRQPEGEPVPVVPLPKVSEPNALETEDAALAAALAAVGATPSVRSHRRVAAEYWRLKVFDRAERHLTLALSLAPRDPRLLDERARLWRDAGVLDRALSDAHLAAYLAPASPEAQNTLGTVLFRLGRAKEARERFGRAAALHPTAAYLQSNLCYAALATGELEAARAACDAALALSPELEAARRNRALVAAALSGEAEEGRTEGTP